MNNNTLNDENLFRHKEVNLEIIDLDYKEPTDTNKSTYDLHVILSEEIPNDYFGIFNRQWKIKTAEQYSELKTDGKKLIIIPNTSIEEYISLYKLLFKEVLKTSNILYNQKIKNLNDEEDKKNKTLQSLKDNFNKYKSEALK